MDKKKLIRKNFLLKRKRKFHEIKLSFFKPLTKFIQKNFKRKNIKIALYYPIQHELNILKIFKIDFFKDCRFSLPKIEQNNYMNFYKWKKKDILNINKYGIVEPIESIKSVPNIILVPLLAFDKTKYRLGYGKGYYDKYLNKYLKIYKNIISIGVAFSFQKYHKLPINKKDVRLDYIITEKGIF